MGFPTIGLSKCCWSVGAAIAGHFLIGLPLIRIFLSFVTESDSVLLVSSVCKVNIRGNPSIRVWTAVAVVLVVGSVWSGRHRTKVAKMLSLGAADSVCPLITGLFPIIVVLVWTEVVWVVCVCTGVELWVVCVTTGIDTGRGPDVWVWAWLWLCFWGVVWLLLWWMFLWFLSPWEVL